MPTDHILSLLIAERDKLNAAIAVLQGGQKKRGRPPKNPMPDWVTSNKLTSNGAAAPVVEAPARKKRNFSPAQRKAAAERMRQMWAKKKKAAKKS
jgi:hypothetical protein